MRIVSLVPSLTESLWELHAGEAVVGVTKFCVHPKEARTRAKVVGGTKDPSVEMILGLKPDLVVADADENKPEHLDTLREAGIAVHVTKIDGVRDAAREVAAIGRLIGRSHESQKWAQEIEEKAATLRETARLLPHVRVFVPIWKKPLMTSGGATYLSDLLATVGLDNVFAKESRRYFEALDEAVVKARPEAVMLPTEPYHFRETDRDEFSKRFGLSRDAILVVDGQALTWFGTRTLVALDEVTDVGLRLRRALANA